MEELKAQDKLNMRQFLMKQVIPVLTEGMIDVYKVGPTDPVDYLSDYIFKKSNELRRRWSQMPIFSDLTYLLKFEWKRLVVSEAIFE